ncbi:MAG: RnfABCDGE type electron transport complex subunit B [Candidatus Omnitrophota bacterium]
MDSLMIASVSSMAALAFVFSAILAFADKKLKVEEDPRVDEINHLLPGVNCGACGFLSCHDFAEHIAAEGADPGKCRVVDEETREKLYEVTGMKGGATHPRLPLVHCAAGAENKEPAADYRGVRTCGAAQFDFGGGMECEYGCMGFGDCVSACPFGALVMQNALPVVIPDKCTGCGKCAAACPRKIISLEEKKYDGLFYVACNSHDGALRVRQICGVGCIACGICVKLAPEGFFKLEDNLSRADHTKQQDQEKVSFLAGKCPTKVIKKL